MTEISKLKIFYFSGTGNAKQIALWTSECAEEKGVASEICNISNIKSLEVFNTKTTIIIISPVHGFFYPKITFDFIRKLPKGNNQVVLMATRAGLRIGNCVTPGLTGVAFFVSKLLLKSKGYRIIGQIPFDMPSNWFLLHPALSQKTVEFIFEKNHSRLKKHMDKLFSRGQNFRSSKDMLQDILISPVSLGYSLAGKYVLAKSFYASAKCTNCNLCINNCPVKAIKTINGKPYWTFRCESCMKCMTNCPANAIESAHGLIVILSILSSVSLSFLSGVILADFFHSAIIKILVFTVLLILFLSVFYRVQHILLRNKYFEKLIILTSLTHYKFWGKRNPKKK
ncbi:EFR1 family ferrodoxin [Bacteroidales bacterium OttesenSCG-928-C19]|nr:EFR1 family ferrodoxin [Bacteroidales bacterium OttesenSCG-928-C19]